jgi:hypothetical protein
VVNVFVVFLGVVVVVVVCTRVLSSFLGFFFPVSRVSFAAIRTVQNSIGVLETLLE